MINNYEQDRIEMAKEIAEVRKTGAVNMFDRRSVIDILESLGYDFTAEYISENKNDYLALLEKSGEY